MIFSSLIVKELQKSIIKGDKAMIYVWIHFVTPFFLAISLSYIYIYIFFASSCTYGSLPWDHFIIYRNFARLVFSIDQSSMLEKSLCHFYFYRDLQTSIVFLKYLY